MRAASTAGASRAVAQLNGGKSSSTVRRSCAAPQPRPRVTAVLTSRVVHQLLSRAPRTAASRPLPSSFAAVAVAAVAAPVAGPLSEKLGLVYNDDGSVDFRVWAPVARSVAVEIVTDGAPTLSCLSLPYSPLTPHCSLSLAASADTARGLWAA
jgi:hypothetical protein